MDVDYQRYILLQEQFVTRYEKDLVKNVILQLDTGFAAGGDDQAFDSITGIPHLRPLNLTSDEELTIEDTKYVPVDRPKATDYIQKGEVLFNNTNSSIWVGKSLVFNEDYLACCSNHITRLTVDLEKAVPQYIADIFNLLRRKRLFEFYCVNFNNQAGINTEMLGNLPIPLPPPDIQRALVTDLDHARATRKAKLAEAEHLLKGMDAVVMRELGLTVPPSESSLTFTVRLSDAFKRLDVHYHQPYFKQLTDLITTIPHKKLGQIITFSHETINPETLNESFFDYIEISGVDLLTGEINSTQELTSTPPSRAKMLVRHDDILVSLTRPHRGAITLVDEAQDGYVASTGFAILRRIIDENIEREYLVCVLRANIGLKQMERGSSGGNYPAITEDELKKILVPIPSDTIQKNIIAELNTRRDRARQLRQEADAIWHEAQARFEQALMG